jgi:regulation of enolase protein 1 (concanavalin A-like superfamily)
MEWLNEPREWKAEGENLSFLTEAETDFWQKTFYGFRHDNGHFYYREVEGDFTAEVVFHAEYEALYDQAGLMLRSGSNAWIKAGVEFAHDRATLSSVVTNGVSDWAIGPQIERTDRIHLRLTCRSHAVCVQWLDGGKFQTLRLSAFTAPEAVTIGPMACSPTRAGLKAYFENFRIGPAVNFAAEV